MTLGHDDAASDEVCFCFEEFQNFVRQQSISNSLLHADRVPLASGVDQGFFEDGLGLDAMSEGQPGSGKRADRVVEVLAGRKKSRFDGSGNDVNAVKVFRNFGDFEGSVEDVGKRIVLEVSELDVDVVKCTQHRIEGLKD